MPHAVRSQMAELFNLPQSRVRVIVETLGGGFGSKGSLRLEPITAFLAFKANRPVKIVLSREEEFVTVCKHPATIRIKTGVMKDGTLVARQVTREFQYRRVQRYRSRSSRATAARPCRGPYKIPHVRIDSFAVWTNIVPAGALRGFGVPQAVWAYESQMDYDRRTSRDRSGGISPEKFAAGSTICSPPEKNWPACTSTSFSIEPRHR